MRRFLTLGRRSFSRVLHHMCGRERAIRLERQQRDAAPTVVGDQQGAATPVHADVAGRATSRRLLVQPGERAGAALDRERAHRAGRLELVHGVEDPAVRVDTKEGRVCAGVYRPDSHQLAGPPVHADEIDAFAIRPYIELIGIRSRLGHHCVMLPRWQGPQHYTPQET